MKQTHRDIQTTDSSQTTTPGRLTTVLGLAAAWSLTMLVISILWGTGALAAPFDGQVQPDEISSLLDRFPVPLAAGMVGFCALLSLVFAATLLTLPKLRTRAVTVVGVFSLLLTLITTVAFTDTLLLAYLGYTVSLQFPPIPTPVLWQGFMMIGPGLWLAAWAAVASSRDSASSAGAARGRRVSTSAKVAVGVAVAVPLIYATTRILWAIGIPFGLSAEFYSEGLRVGLWHSGLALALAGIAGALLTLGLVQRWGERLPRWMGPLAGRRVPILLAVIPASIVALALFTGGMGLLRTILIDGIEGGVDQNVVTIGPTFLFPVWALALGWATYEYRARRRAAEANRPRPAESLHEADSSAGR